MTPSRIESDKDTEMNSSTSSAYTPSSVTCTSPFSSSGSSSGASTRSSRLDSYLSSPRTSSSRRRATSESIRSRRHHRSPSASSLSTGSGSRSRSGSRKSILKSKKKESKSPKSRKSRRSSARRPIGEFKMINDELVKKQVRSFLTDYSASDPTDFDAFSLSVDGIPFVAVSLMNAPPELRLKLEKTPIPPTPMRKHTPGVNSPRKRRLSSQCSSIHSSKCVRFSDENHRNSIGRRSRSSSAEDARELTEKISEALIDNNRKYHDLWHDRVEEKDRK